MLLGLQLLFPKGDFFLLPHAPKFLWELFRVFRDYPRSWGPCQAHGDHPRHLPSLGTIPGFWGPSQDLWDHPRLFGTIPGSLGPPHILETNLGEPEPGSFAPTSPPTPNSGAQNPIEGVQPQPNPNQNNQTIPSLHNPQIIPNLFLPHPPTPQPRSNPISKPGSQGGFASPDLAASHKNVPGRAGQLMYSGCFPSSRRINIALSFPSPSEPAEEPWKKKPGPGTAPAPKTSAPAGRLYPAPAAPFRRLLRIKYSG